MDFLGYLAAILTTAAFVPQVLKTWQSKSADDLSLTMLITFTAGVFLWLVYGVWLASWPVVAGNAVTFVLSLGLLVMRLQYRS
ncbi:MAG: SemiSWEET transporter [Vicinamibacterales bacterium]